MISARVEAQTSAQNGGWLFFRRFLVKICSIDCFPLMTRKKRQKIVSCLAGGDIGLDIVQKHRLAMWKGVFMHLIPI